MNIHHLLQAVEHVRAALIATIKPDERAKLEKMDDDICAILRSYGVFIGTRV